MIDHVALQVADVNAATEFYVEVFAPCGLRVVMRSTRQEGTVVGIGGPDGFPHLWFGPLVDPGIQQVHLALTAPSREAVDAVQAAARRVGAELLHGARLWPEYHPGYYGVFMRDPDGNNVEAVHHSFS